MSDTNKLKQWQLIYTNVKECVHVNDDTDVAELNRRELAEKHHLHLEVHHLPWGGACRDSEACSLYRVVHSLSTEPPADDDVCYVAVLPQPLKKNKCYFTVRVFGKVPRPCRHCGQFILHLLYPTNKHLSVYKFFCSRQCAESHDQITRILMAGPVVDQMKIVNLKDRMRRECLALDEILRRGHPDVNSGQHTFHSSSHYGPSGTATISNNIETAVRAEYQSSNFGPRSFAPMNRSFPPVDPWPTFGQYQAVPYHQHGPPVYSLGGFSVGRSFGSGGVPGNYAPHLHNYGSGINEHLVSECRPYQVRRPISAHAPVISAGEAKKQQPRYRKAIAVSEPDNHLPVTSPEGTVDTSVGNASDAAFTSRASEEDPLLTDTPGTADTLQSAEEQCPEVDNEEPTESPQTSVGRLPFVEVSEAADTLNASTEHKTQGDDKEASDTVLVREEHSSVVDTTEAADTLQSTEEQSNAVDIPESTKTEEASKERFPVEQTFGDTDSVRSSGEQPTKIDTTQETNASWSMEEQAFAVDISETTDTEQASTEPVPIEQSAEGTDTVRTSGEQSSIIHTPETEDTLQSMAEQPKAGDIPDAADTEQASMEHLPEGFSPVVTDTERTTEENPNMVDTSEATNTLRSTAEQPQAVDAFESKDMSQTSEVHLPQGESSEAADKLRASWNTYDGSGDPVIVSSPDKKDRRSVREVIDIQDTPEAKKVFEPVDSPTGLSTNIAEEQSNIIPPKQASQIDMSLWANISVDFLLSIEVQNIKFGSILPPYWTGINADIINSTLRKRKVNITHKDSRVANDPTSWWNDVVILFFMQWLFRCESYDSNISFIDPQVIKGLIRDCTCLMSVTQSNENKVTTARFLHKTLTKGGKSLLSRNVTLIPMNINNNHWILCALFNPKFCVDKPSAGSTKRSSNSFIAVFDSLRPDEGVGERVAEKILFLRRSLNFLAQENDERTVWNLDQGPFTESTLPVFLPTWVPQQPNVYDCGVYTCRFAYSLLYWLKFQPATIITMDYLANHGAMYFLWPDNSIRNMRTEVALLIADIYDSQQTVPTTKRLKSKAAVNTATHVTVKHQQDVMKEYYQREFVKCNPGIKVPTNNLLEMMKWRQRNENCSTDEDTPSPQCGFTVRSTKAQQKIAREVCAMSGLAESFQCRWNSETKHTINDALFLRRRKHNVLLCEWTIEHMPSTGDCGFFALFKAVRQKWRSKDRFTSCEAFLTAQVPETLEQFRLILAKAITSSPTKLRSYVASCPKFIRRWNFFRDIVPVDDLNNAEVASSLWEKPVFDLISTPAYLWFQGDDDVEESVPLYLSDDVMETIQELYGLKILVVRTHETLEDVVLVPGQCTHAIHKWPDFRRWPLSSLGYVLLDFDYNHFDLYSCRATGRCVLSESELDEMNTVKACFDHFYQELSTYKNFLLPYWYDRIIKEHYRDLHSLGQLRCDCLHLSDLNAILSYFCEKRISFSFQATLHSHTGNQTLYCSVVGGVEMEVTSSDETEVRVQISTDGVMISLAQVSNYATLNGIVLFAMYFGLILLPAKEAAAEDKFEPHTKVSVFERKYRKVYITHQPDSSVCSTTAFNEWITKNNFGQIKSRVKFGGVQQPTGVRYWIKSARDGIETETAGTSLDSDEKAYDPQRQDRKLPSRKQFSADREKPLDSNETTVADKAHKTTGTSRKNDNHVANGAANELYANLLRNLTESDKAARAENTYDAGRLCMLVKEDNGFWRDEEKWKDHKKTRKRFQFLLHPDTRKQGETPGNTYDYDILTACNHIFGLLDELYRREKQTGSHAEKFGGSATVVNSFEEADCPLAKVLFTNVPANQADENLIFGAAMKNFDQRIPKKQKFQDSQWKKRTERYTDEEEFDWWDSIFHRKRTKL